MVKYIVSFLLALCFITGLVLAYGAYRTEQRSEMPTSLQGDAGVEGEVIKVVPQEFPINELSDSWFGKEVQRDDELQYDVDSSPLSESAGDVPDWLDQIISRESIVAFNKNVLAQHPNEVQFSQTSQRSFGTTEGWNAFLTEFETKPTGFIIAVMGAYKNEDESYWMSEVLPSRTEMSLQALQEIEGGALLFGRKGEQSFTSSIKKETATMTVSP